MWSWILMLEELDKRLQYVRYMVHLFKFCEYSTIVSIHVFPTRLLLSPLVIFVDLRQACLAEDARHSLAFAHERLAQLQHAALWLLKGEATKTVIIEDWWPIKYGEQDVRVSFQQCLLMLKEDRRKDMKCREKVWNGMTCFFPVGHQPSRDSLTGDFGSSWFCISARGIFPWMLLISPKRSSRDHDSARLRWDPHVFPLWSGKEKTLLLDGISMNVFVCFFVVSTGFYVDMETKLRPIWNCEGITF